MRCQKSGQEREKDGKIYTFFEVSGGADFTSAVIRGHRSRHKKTLWPKANGPPRRFRRAHQFPNRIEYNLELGVIPLFQLLKFARQGRMGTNHLSKPYESPHDLNAGGHGDGTVEDEGCGNRAVFREGERRLAQTHLYRGIGCRSLRYPIGHLLFSELKHKIIREPLAIPLDLLVETRSCHSVCPGQVTVQHHPVAADRNYLFF